MEEPKHYSDQELLALLRSGGGTDAALRYLYRTHFDLLTIYVRQHSGSAQDAEDVFQEVMVTFVDLAQHNKFRGESSIKTFLFALNRNIWLNELKKRQRSFVREMKFENAKPVEEQAIAEYIAAREGRKQVMELVNKLGPTCQQILVAYYYHNLSMNEILSHLNYENEQVVRNKKYKCMKKLESLIAANPILAENLKTALQYEQ